MILTPQERDIRDERLDRLLGTRGKASEKALIVADVLGQISDQISKQIASTPYTKGYSSVLAANVPMPANAAWVSGPTLGLLAGTYLITATAACARNAATPAQVEWSMQILAGSTAIAATTSGDSAAASASAKSMTLTQIYTVTAAQAPLTLTLQAACSTGASGTDNQLLASVAPLGTAIPGCTAITAVKIGK